MKSNSPKKIWKSSPYMMVLSLFLENPTKELFGSEVKKVTRLSAGAAHNYLAQLEHDGMLVASIRGRMKFYKLNRSDPSVRHLKISYSLSSPPIRSLVNAAKSAEGIEVYLYGSAARGEDDEQSDWDILILGSIKMLDVLNMLRDARRLASPREMKPNLYSRQEWAAAAKDDSAFYDSIERDKIRLV